MLNGKAHFTSLHGKVGVLTLALLGASPLLGSLSFRRLGLLQRLPEGLQPHVKWLHRLVSGGQGVGGTSLARSLHPPPHPPTHPSRHPPTHPLQLGVCAWCLALVEMQLALPHPAVMQGVLCRAWQAGVAALALVVLSTLRGRLAPGRSALPTVASGGYIALGAKHA